MMRKYLSFLLSFVLLFLLSACGSAEIASKIFDTDSVSSTFDGEIIAENSSLQLKWDDTTKGVVLIDRKTGMEYGTTPVGDGKNQVDELGMPVKKHPRVNSPIVISYLDYETNTVIDAASYTAAVENGRVRCAKGKDALLVEFYFDGPQIMVPVQYILKDDCLQIRIDADDIQENANKIIRVSIAPFLCSVENDNQDGYLFVPSGSGTLIKPETISQQGASYSSQMYGADGTIEMISKTTETESVRLPVYGVRSEENKGMVAIIDGAADTAFIEVNTGAVAYGYSAVYSSFQLRGYTGHVADMFSGLTVESTVYSKAKISGTLSVSFYPLTGDSADYMGMALKYRDYLKREYALPDSAEDFPLSFTFLGGTMVTDSFFGIPYQRLYAATTLRQSYEISEDIFNEFNVPLNIILKGFGTTGIDPGTVGGGFKVSAKFGNGSDLGELRKLCIDNSAGFYIDFDVVRFAENGNGFSKLFNVSSNAGEEKAAQYFYNPAALDQEESTLHYLLSPSEIDDAVQKLITAAKKMEINGLSLSTMTSMSYSDYSDKSCADYYSKSGFSRLVTENLTEIKKNDFKIASFAANDYAAVQSDTILNVPLQSDREHIFYTDIPFYEIVFRGAVPMATGSINLSADRSRLILNAVESGCGLNYTVTANWSNELLTVKQPLFYNCVYSEIKDDIIRDMQCLSNYYEKIDGAHIIEHQLLTESLRMTVFDNNVAVYVNYGKQAAESPAGMVEAGSFLVTER